MKIALVYNWPGFKNSELDLIGRIAEVIQKYGHESVVIEPFGNVLTSEGMYPETRSRVREEELDFVLNLHYSNPNFLDAFSYFTNWNPLEYITHHPSTGVVSDFQELQYLHTCMQSHDAAVSAGSDLLDDYMRVINIYNLAFCEYDGLQLHPSSRLYEGIEPISINDFKIFYIGINWEKLSPQNKKKGRHNGLLESLDASGYFSFYGIEKLYGKKLWEGFKHYKGELPFDNGESIVKIANRCGVSLVLSSEAHRRSALVSTRIFQACAARTVIISDDNPFIKKYFGDSILIFKYSNDSQSNYLKIMELVEWIRNNPIKALEKAEEAHHIFKNTFSLDSEIQALLEMHEEINLKHCQYLLPLNEQHSVDVIWVQEKINGNEIDLFINKLNSQEGSNPIGIIISTNDSIQNIENHLKRRSNFKYHCVGVEYFSHKDGYYLLKTIREICNSEAFIIYYPRTNWKRRHLGFLLRRMQDSNNNIVQIGSFIRNAAFQGDYDKNFSKISNQAHFRPFSMEHITNFSIDMFLPDSFIFRKKLVTDNVPSTMAFPITYMGWYFYLILINYMNHGDLPEFINKYTISFDRDDSDYDNYDIDNPTVNNNLLSDARFIASVMAQSNEFRRIIFNSNSVLNSTSEEYNLLKFINYVDLMLSKRPVLRSIFNFFRKYSKKILKW